MVGIGFELDGRHILFSSYLGKATLNRIGLAPGADGARIAWEAHAVGFLFGILAIGPIGGWFAARRDLPIGGV